MLFKLILLSFLLSSSVFANFKAQVLIVKGNVTKLIPHAKVSAKVKKGDWLVQDTSLVTHARSMARIKFDDGTMMNIGPKSMIVINKIQKDNPNVINLLTGMVKAQVKKKQKENKKSKLIIQTRSSVMGVRGTKFQAMYNHANKRTSLITVEGKVAMARKIQKLDTPNFDLDSVEKTLDIKADVVQVEAGQYSGVIETVSKPTVPVKISPTQFKVLAKKMNSSMTIEKTVKPSENIDTARGVTNLDKGVLRPVAGGIVDFKTGLYISPSKNAKFDDKTKTFQSKNIGAINNSTGDYIPPKGLKIDATKGFIIDKELLAKSSNKVDQKKLTSTLTELNNDVKIQVTTVKDLEKEKNLKEIVKKKPPMIKQHILSANFISSSDELGAFNTVYKHKNNFKSKQSNWYILSWEQMWNEKFGSRIRFGTHKYTFSDENITKYDYWDDGNSGDGFFSLGVNYHISDDWRLFLDIVKKDEKFLVPFEQGRVAHRSKELDSLAFSFKYKLCQIKKAKLNIHGIYHFSADEKLPSVNGNDSSGRIENYQLGLEGVYSLNKPIDLSAEVFSRRFYAENSDLEFDRKEKGLSLTFIYNL